MQGTKCSFSDEIIVIEREWLCKGKLEAGVMMLYSDERIMIEIEDGLTAN